MTIAKIVGLLNRAATALWKTPVTVCVALLLLIGDAIMAVLSPAAQLSVAAAASTNITHLAVDPLLVLPASAFVDTTNVWFWVPLTLLFVGGIERRLGGRRTLLVTFGAHVVASLVSEGVLLIQIAWRLQPRSDINILDVGPSYVLLAALAACLVIGSWPLRASAFVIGALIIPNLLVDLPELDMSAVGHFCAIVLGASLAGYLSTARSREHSSRIREAAAKAADATRRVGEGVVDVVKEPATNPG